MIMANGESELQPFLSHAEPVLAVRDVSETVLYWHNVLGFPAKWTWGEPPNHGGVSWHGVYVQFSQDPGLASVSKGNAIFIRVRNLETLYSFHQKNNAEIIEPLENKPWGMAGYTVREMNDYYVIFAGALIPDRKHGSTTLPHTVKIIARTPAAKEYLDLISAVGWGKYNNDAMVEKILEAPVFAVVAEDEMTNEIIGCALLLSDGASFFYVKDVMVHPNWQGKRVGSAMMKEVVRWLDNNAPGNAYIGLFTPENLSAFYKQFDFAPVFGMHRRVQRNEKSR
jgi:GNAT superfamily N-acetyltransferase